MGPEAMVEALRRFDEFEHYQADSSDLSDHPTEAEETEHFRRLVDQEDEIQATFRRFYRQLGIQPEALFALAEGIRTHNRPHPADREELARAVGYLEGAISGALVALLAAQIAGDYTPSLPEGKNQ